jgi:hypothetical protein
LFDPYPAPENFIKNSIQKPQAAKDAAMGYLLASAENENKSFCNFIAEAWQ